MAECNHTPGTKLWSFDAATGNVNFSVAMAAQWERYWAPVMANGRVFSNGGYYGGLYGFDASSGANLFYRQLPQEDGWSPALEGNVVYTFLAGRLRQLDALTGLDKWDAVLEPSGNYGRTTPVVGGGLVYVIAGSVLYAVDPGTHLLKWSATGLSFSGVPAYFGGAVYAVSAGSIRVHDAQTGAYQWTFVGDGALSYPPVIAGGILYASSSANVYAVDLTTHLQLATLTGGGWISIANGKVYIAGPNGVLRAYALTP